MLMKNLTRRQFLASTTVAATSASLLLNTRTTLAAEAPRLDPNNAQAKALSYVHESPKADNLCANCPAIHRCRGRCLGALRDISRQAGCQLGLV